MAPAGTRLYVGNLSPSVDEYTLMQVCSKAGKIAKLDFLFHKAGPLRGKPRGYAFVEFASVDEAQRAVSELDGKLVRGRKMSVTTAAEQQTYQPDDGKFGRPRPGHNDAHKPTPISLLKGNAVNNASTSKKIAALEAKLAAMKRGKETPTATPSPPPQATSASTSGSQAGSSRLKGSSEAGPSSSSLTAAAMASAGLPLKPNFAAVERDEPGGRR